MENERVAILETKVDALIDCVQGLKKDIRAVTTAYSVGKYVLSLSTTFLAWINWDAILMFFHPPKH